MVKKLLLYLILFLTSLFADTKSDGLFLINEIRSKAGLNTLSQNNILETAAQNHADYIVDILTTYNNKPFVGHYEPYQSSYFTGYDPWDRGFYAGYNTSAYYLENLSSGQANIDDSIDGLMSAIYHRFGFLNNNINEIGIGIVESNEIYNYNMGNSYLNTLCSGTSLEYGIYGICKDSSLIIDANEYNLSLNKIAKTNPKYIIWPINNEDSFRPSFFEEHPDPLSDYSVSGNPISIEFNDQYYKQINSYTFELYDSNNNLISHSRVLDNITDPNTKFSILQFAFFPLDRLEFNSNYSVKFDYSATLVDDTSETDTLIWSFKTKTTPYPMIKVIESNQTINIKNNTKYSLYFPPTDETDVIKSYGISYSYSGEEPSMSIKFTNDQNVLEVEVNATKTDKLVLTKVNNDNEELLVNLQISDADAAVYWNESNNSELTTSNSDVQTQILGNLMQGWHLLGAIRDISLNELSNFYIVWKYEKDTWYAYSNTINLTNLVDNQFDLIKEGDGFWVNIQ